MSGGRKEGTGLTKGQDETFGVVIIFILRIVLVSWVYTRVKTSNCTFLKCGV